MTMNQFSIRQHLKVVRIQEESKQARTFWLEPLDDWNPVYEAGQFLTLAFDTPYGEKRRSYSFSSSPATDTGLAITVKRLDNGEFSRFLVDSVKVGDVLRSTGIGGLFVLPDDRSSIQQYFFIAAGSGITPCFSLIKTLLHEGDRLVTLIYSNRSPEDTIFYSQLQELQEAYPQRLNIKFLFRTQSGVYNSRLSSWLLGQLLDEYLQVTPEEAACYVCGPFDYMLTVQITLLSRFPAGRIRKEDYSSLPRKVRPQPPDTALHQAEIRIGGQQFSVPVQYPDTILDAAIKQGIQLPYSCRSGRCASCIATCHRGNVWMAYNEVLTDDEVAKGRILVCQSYPVGGDVEISYSPSGSR